VQVVAQTQELLVATFQKLARGPGALPYKMTVPATSVDAHAWIQAHLDSPARAYSGARGHEPTLLYEVWEARFSCAVDAMSILFAHLPAERVLELANDRADTALAAYAGVRHNLLGPTKVHGTSG